MPANVLGLRYLARAVGWVVLGVPVGLWDADSEGLIGGGELCIRNLPGFNERTGAGFLEIGVRSTPVGVARWHLQPGFGLRELFFAVGAANSGDSGIWRGGEAGSSRSDRRLGIR
jgi:hypothetical protein